MEYSFFFSYILTYEIIILARSKLETTRLGRERAEGDGEVKQPVRLITDSDDPWVRVRYSARVVLLFRHLLIGKNKIAIFSHTKKKEKKK